MFGRSFVNVAKEGGVRVTHRLSCIFHCKAVLKQTVLTSSAELTICLSVFYLRRANEYVLSSFPWLHSPA
jgi:hypothetical protein